MGYPGFSPFLTRRKNATIALSRRRSVACCEENDHRTCRSGSNARISLSCADCCPQVTVTPRCLYEPFLSSNAPLYSEQ